MRPVHNEEPITAGYFWTGSGRPVNVELEESESYTLRYVDCELFGKVQGAWHQEGNRIILSPAHCQGHGLE